MSASVPYGTLYGIGVGPGDPELITQKAVRILAELDHVFAPVAVEGERSLALTIASTHLRAGCQCIALPFAMSHDVEVKGSLWRDSGARIAALLLEGKNVGFLTLGDPLIYSTWGYLLRELRRCHPNLTVATIPGITSFQAAAARLGEPLVEGDETLWITSSRQLTKNLAGQPLPADNLVVMKAAARLRETIAWLEQRNLLPGCHAVRRCSHADETVFMDPKELLAEKPDYWTLLLCFARRS